MMMPANFSAISENEMTYVNGGASLSEILAPELKLENWQKFNQNMVTIIGNSFLGSYVSNTVGTLFGGAYKPGNLGKAWFSSVSKYYNSGYDAVVGNGSRRWDDLWQYCSGYSEWCSERRPAYRWVPLLPSTTWQPPTSRTVCPASLTSRRVRPSSLNKTV